MPFSIVVLAYFFSKMANPRPEQLAILRRWFWLTGFSERYRGAVEGILEQDLSAVDSLHNGDYDAMNVRISFVDNDILKRQFWKNSAFCKTFVVMLANNAPKNLTNGEVIDIREALTSFNSKEFHHIFPKDFLKKLGVNSEKRNALANICMLSASQNKNVSNDSPSVYLTKSFNALGKNAEIVFNSNLISSAIDAPWRADKYDLFLKQRAKIILNEINKLCGIAQ